MQIIKSFNIPLANDKVQHLLFSSFGMMPCLIFYYYLPNNEILNHLSSPMGNPNNYTKDQRFIAIKTLGDPILLIRSGNLVYAINDDNLSNVEKLISLKSFW